MASRAAGLKHQKIHRPKAVEVDNPDCDNPDCDNPGCVLLCRLERVGEGLPVGSSYSGYVVPTYSRL